MAEAVDRGLVRAMNRSAVLRTVKRDGPLSRAEIARASGMSHVTVGSIVSELLDWQLLVEGGEAPSTGGRPSRPLLLNAGAYVAAGVKVTEQRLVGALTDLGATVLAEIDRPLSSSDPRAVAGAIAQVVAELLEMAGMERSRLLGAGVGLAGVVDTGEGLCRFSPYLGWRDVKLGGLLASELGVPALVDNDVNTLALAERWFGAGQAARTFLLVTVGRGVGLGVVIDGALYRGAAGGAGEFGHTLVDGSDRRCDCGNTGCLEASVSERALLEQAQMLRRRKRRQVPASVEELYGLLADDPDCAQLVIDAGRMLGRGVANLVNVFAPELVILSGEGLGAGELFVDAVRDEASRRGFNGLSGSWELIAEDLPEAAWARGAASLVLAELFETPTRTQLDLLAPFKGSR